jgi:hypothetical protein
MARESERRILPERVKCWKLQGGTRIWGSIMDVPDDLAGQRVSDFRVLYGGKWRRVLGTVREGPVTYLRIT